MTDSLVRRQDETDIDYKKRIYLYRDLYGLTWMDIATILNKEFNVNYTADKYRKESYKLLDADSSEVIKADDKIFEFKKEQVKLNDQRLQINALTRLAAREETFKEIALEVANSISQNKVLDIPDKIQVENTSKKAILCLGDWHYGLDVDLFYNQYDTEIAVQRINTLLNKTIEHISEHGIDDLYVINLGDMISGRIHLPLRINNRIDTVQQTIEISEILAEFLYISF